LVKLGKDLFFILWWKQASIAFKWLLWCITAMNRHRKLSNGNRGWSWQHPLAVQETNLCIATQC